MKIVKKLPYEKKKSLAGFLFISVWLIGFIYFFIIPFIYAFVFSTSEIFITPGSMDFVYKGFGNYVSIFTTEPQFVIRLTDTLREMVWQLPMIIVFSIFVAILLNSKFKGRLFVRTIFFLPVIIASGVIINIMTGSSINTGSSMMSSSSSLFQGLQFESMLLNFGFPFQIVEQIMRIINGMFELVWKSGVQILLLLAGLQSIPKYLYEAADVEGATPWESFWKITFPLLSPTTILCVFYSIVDMSADNSNLIVQYITDIARQSKFSLSSTMSVVWFGIVILFAGIVFLLTRRYIYFMDDRG